MEEKFSKWSNQKEYLDSEGKIPFFHEREIWSCKLGVNIGFEEDGKGEAFLRPIIILKKFNSRIFWAIPLTHTKKQTEFYFRFPFSETETSTAILSQMRLLDGKRLSHKIGIIPKERFVRLKEKVRTLMS